MLPSDAPGVLEPGFSLIEPPPISSFSSVLGFSGVFVPSEPEPSELGPSELEPSELEPSELEPSELEPSELEPSELEPSELEPSELGSSELEPGFSLFEPPPVSSSSLSSGFPGVLASSEPPELSELPGLYTRVAPSIV